MDDFVIKPIQPDTLAGIIARYGERQPRAGEPGADRGDGAPAEPISTNGGEVLAPKALDQLLKMVGGDRALLTMVIDSFLADSPQLMDSLRQSAARENAQELYLAAHTLKSLGSSFGATTFAQLCREMESMSQAGRLDGIAGRLQHVEDEYAQVTSALESLRNRPIL
jgi:HPt (histidine-containing phosphotransfer) domain-containing protein